MKYLIFILLLLKVSISNASICFSAEEYSNISSELERLNKFYDYVPSIIKCPDNSELGGLVCSNLELENAVLLLTKASVYAYENATHTPQNFENEEYKHLLNNAIKEDYNKSKSVDMRKLCYLIKSDLNSYLGSYFKFKPNVYESILSKKNKNGIIINSWGMTSMIYLGNSCDAIIGSSDEKGIWYNDGDQFVIAQPDKDGKFKEKYRFNHDDNVAQLNCQKPTN